MHMLKGGISGGSSEFSALELLCLSLFSCPEAVPRSVLSTHNNASVLLSLDRVSPSVLSLLSQRRAIRSQSRDWVVSGWNVNGLRCLWKKRGLVPFLLRVFPDILILTELKSCLSRLPSELFATLAALGYKHVFLNTCELPRSGYSGVAVFTSARAVPLHVQSGIGVKDVDQEARVTTLFYSSLIIVGVYVTCSGLGPVRDHKRVLFNKAFRAHLLQLKALGFPLLVVGDLNVARRDNDVFDGSKNPSRKKWGGFKPYERQDFEELLRETQLFDVFEKLQCDDYDRYTYHFNPWHRRRNQGWRLDYFLSSADLLDDSTSGPVIKKMWLDHAALGLSDHLPIVCSVAGAAGVPFRVLPEPPVSVRGRLVAATKEGVCSSFASALWPSWLLYYPLSLFPVDSTVGVLRGSQHNRDCLYTTFIRAMGLSVTSRASQLDVLVAVCDSADVVSKLEQVDGILERVKKQTGLALPWALFSDVDALNQLGLLDKDSLRVIIVEDWGYLTKSTSLESSEDLRCFRGAWLCGNFPDSLCADDRVVVERRCSGHAMCLASSRLMSSGIPTSSSVSSSRVVGSSVITSAPVVSTSHADALELPYKAVVPSAPSKFRTPRICYPLNTKILKRMLLTVSPAAVYDSESSNIRCPSLLTKQTLSLTPLLAICCMFLLSGFLYKGWRVPA